MATPLNTIKNWFKTGLKPTQAQFWAVFDSFRHKSQKVPYNEVEGLETAMDAKAEKELLLLHINNETAHKILITIDGEPFVRKKGHGNTGTGWETGDLAQDGYLVVDDGVIKTDLILIDAAKDLATYTSGAWQEAGNGYYAKNNS